jgi:hypothetical protein
MTIIDVIWPPLQFLFGLAVAQFAFVQFIRGCNALWDSL